MPRTTRRCADVSEQTVPLDQHVTIPPEGRSTPPLLTATPVPTPAPAPTTTTAPPPAPPPAGGGLGGRLQSLLGG